MSNLEQNREPLHVLNNKEPGIRYKDTTDQSIRPVVLWQRTGEVKVGETGFGCPVECAYCNQQSLDIAPGEGRQAGYLFPMDAGVAINSRLMIGPRKDKTIPLDHLFAELKSYPHYDPQGTVILENYNDPGTNWRQTLEMMKRLVTEVGHTGAIAFITKMGISPTTARELKGIQEMGGKPIGIVTYSGMPHEIEPINPKARRGAMQQLKENNIPVIMSMRPMVRGMNATEANLRQTLNETRGLPDIITVGGLFVFPETIEQFEKAGLPLPEEYTTAAYPLAKNLPVEIRSMVRDAANKEGIETPISNHTSCAISRLITTRYSDGMNNKSSAVAFDRMAHWAGESKPGFESYCSTFCTEKQMDVCRKVSESPIESVIDKAQAKLAKIGYPDLSIIPSLTQAGQLLIVGGSLPFEETITIKQACGFDVINLPTDHGVRYRSKQAFEEFGGDYDTGFAGAVLVGQEWHVFVNGSVDGADNILTLRWLRHQNRARIQLVDTQKFTNNDSISKLIENLYNKSLGLQSKETIVEQVSDILARR